ncbi:Hypothetical predicted protein, partial [Paramuricea clavata]
MMTMKLLYYDDVTPPDYQPPGFEDTEYLGHNFGEGVYRIDVGDITTRSEMTLLAVSLRRRTPTWIDWVGLRVQSKMQAKYRRPDETSHAKDEINHHEMQEDESYLDREPDAKLKTEDHKHVEE